MIDWTPLVNAGLTVASVVVSGAGSLFAVWLNRKLKLDANSAAADEIDRAVHIAGGIAYGAMASGVTSTVAGSTRTAALNAGVQYVIDSAPDAVKKLGIPTSDLWQRVSGSFADRLAVDPTVTVSAPVAAAPVVATATPATAS